MIEEKALELGRMLGQTNEHKAVRTAHEELEATPEVKAQMQRVEMINAKLEPYGKEGKEPPKELTEEIEKLVSSIQAHPNYQKVVAAQSNFDKMMLRVNEQIIEGMKKGAESSIILPG